MKKIVALVMVLCSSFMLFGCKKEENKFWENTYNNYASYKEDKVVLPYLGYLKDIEYTRENVDLNTVIKDNRQYTVLLLDYELLIDSEMEVIDRLSSSFLIKPYNTSTKVEKLYKDFEKSMKTFADSIKEYEKKKNDFVSRIDLDKLNEDYSLQLLKETKREMRKVIVNANNCKNKVLEIYNETIKEYPTEEVEKISKSTMQYMLLEKTSYLLDGEVAYFLSFEENKEELAKLNLLEKIVDTIAKYYDLTETPYSEFLKEKSYIERLQNETKFFKIAIDNIDMEKAIIDANYLKTNPDLKVYFDKIEYYLNI